MKNDILNYLDEIIKNPKCELIYHKDYELLISTMLSAQTTDKRVNEVTSILYKKYPSIEALSKAKVADIENIIRPLGNQHKKAMCVLDIANKLKLNSNLHDRNNLESMKGVGRKTANVVLSTLYGEDVIAVDTHVARVSKRLGLADDNDSVEIIEDKLVNYFKDYDKSLLHHKLLLFGRYYCKAINPKCTDCKLKNICKKS